MAKIPMKRISIVGLKKDTEKILNLLQRAGVVEIAQEETSKNSSEVNTFASDITRCETNKKSCEHALEILNKYSEDKSGGILQSFSNAKGINVNEYESKVQNVDSTMELVNEIENISKEIYEQNTLIPKYENKIVEYTPWKNLDVALSDSGTSKTKVIIGSFNKELTEDDIYNAVLSGLSEDIAKYVNIDILSKSKTMTCVMVITLKEFGDKVEDQLKKNEFELAPLTKNIPLVEIDNINAKIKETKNNITTLETKLKIYGEKRELIKFAYDYFALEQEKFENKEKMFMTDNAYVISGYVIGKLAEDVRNKIANEVDAYVEITEPAEGEEVPVALTNGFFADPMETVVESYSMPGVSESDPSPVIACFYYILFGFMLSDAGYGLMLVIGTLILMNKVKDMKPGMKKMMKLFCFGGVCTTICGILFGSFFGNAVDVIAWYIRGDMNANVKDFPVLVPFLQKLHVYWFNPVEEPMKLLVVAFILGLLHLFTGLAIKGYTCLKNKDVKGFVYDVVFWFLFVGGGVAYLLTMEMVTGMVGMAKPIGEPLPTIAGIVMGIGCLGVVLTSGRESRNWFKRLLKGAYGAYGITGWLSDVLSYSRLLALGLATGIIAEVFNTMGSMVKVPFLGLIVFIIVFVVGHILNLGINVLGAYVHTNRLQFVEFFGKFYDGGGKKFAPLSENTKYFYVKEEK